jgi:hypothetical protein
MLQAAFNASRQDEADQFAKVSVEQAKQQSQPDSLHEERIAEIAATDDVAGRDINGLEVHIVCREAQQIRKERSRSQNSGRTELTITALKEVPVT